MRNKVTDHDRSRTTPETAPKWFAVLFITAIALGIIGCSRHDDEKVQKLEPFSAATLSWPGSTPLYIAMEKGYFREEGLDFKLQTVATGKAGLDAVLSGQVDCTGAADTPIARAVTNGSPISVLATIAQIERAIILIAKKDSGISDPADLRGKTIGVTFGAGAQFFLHIYLVAYNIDPASVRIVDVPPDKTIDALLRGEVQAVSTWSPYKLVLLDRLGNDAVVLADPDLYLQTFSVVATEQFVRSHPDRVKKFLRALLRADRFIQKNPDEARNIMSKYIGTANTLYQREWTDYSFNTVLDQSLVLNLEDQARWMIKEGKNPGQKVPNFLNNIAVEPLKAVQPEAVTILGK